MTNETKSKLAVKATKMMLTTVLLAAARAMAAEGADISMQPAAAPAQKIEEPKGKRQIVVSIPDRKLALLEDSRLLKVYPVAVGAKVSPSPTGEFRVINRVVKPTYYHAGTVIAPGPANPLGTRWMGLSLKGYGIHGTNAPRSIGKAASHGCIRMAKADLEELFEMVRAGDTVEIRGEADAQTAQLFGETKVVAQATTASAAGGQ